MIRAARCGLKSKWSLFHWFRRNRHVEIIFISAVWLPIIGFWNISPAKASSIFISEEIIIRNLPIEKNADFIIKDSAANIFCHNLRISALEWSLNLILSNGDRRRDIWCPFYSPCVWKAVNENDFIEEPPYNRRCPAVVNGAERNFKFRCGSSVLRNCIVNTAYTRNNIYLSVNKDIGLFQNSKGILGHFSGPFRSFGGFFGGNYGILGNSNLLFTSAPEPFSNYDQPHGGDKESVSENNEKCVGYFGITKKFISPALFFTIMLLGGLRCSTAYGMMK